jgi:hypothetical protein
VTTKKLPAIQFYVGDWKKDVGLQSCSIAARGLWFELLLMMHESPVRGYLMLTESIPMNDEHIARVAGVDQQMVTHLIEELQANGVFDFSTLELACGSVVNVIASRRMVRDESKRQKCSAAGLRGVQNNPLAMGTYKGGPIGRDSSSSSTAMSSSTAITEEELLRLKSIPGVQEVWREVPKDKQRKPKTSQIEIAVALDRMRDPNRVAFLKGRVRAYYSSPEGSSKFHRSLIRWLQDEGYKEPDDAWSAREETRREL